MNEYNLHTISIAEIRNATFMSLLYGACPKGEINLALRTKLRKMN